MSSSPAGKFQDHYAILGVEPTADSETIQAAYARLSQKLHPGNAETGSKEKFEALNQAFEVLSDPGLRASFDKVKGIDHDAGKPKFSGVEFFGSLQRANALRSAVLCVLYDLRRIKSFKPSLSMRNLEGMLTASSEDLNFALWYLKKRGFVANDDKSNLEITVDGMDFVEQNRPSPKMVMPFFKPDAVVEMPESVEAQESDLPFSEGQAPEMGELFEPALNILNKALERTNAVEEMQRVAFTK